MRKSSMLVDESAVFRRIKETHNRAEGRHLIINDVNSEFPTDIAAVEKIIRDEQLNPRNTAQERAAANLKYLEYAKDCNFRSIIAFPIKEPEELPNAITLKPNKLRGFFCLDAESTKMFDEFKKPDSKSFQTLDFYYAIADCLATVAIFLDEIEKK